MMKRMRSMNGIVGLSLVGLTGFALASSIVAYTGAAVAVGTVAVGFVQTAQDGTLKKNGQTIWCKMQNKGQEVCDAKYVK